MSEKLSKAPTPEAAPETPTHGEHPPRASRVKSTFIEMEAILQYIEKEEQADNASSGAASDIGEVVQETDEVLIFWKHHTTRMRPVHANSHRTTF